ncbi:MAG: MFS transporter [Chloroflexi bacterium]|nr:MFS transporter [Chloroflexota bacterium]
MRIKSRVNGMYYGWWVLVGTTLLAAISGGVLFHGASVFFIPIRQELGLSVAQTSLIFTSSRALAGVGGPLFGWMADRYGGRPLIIVGSLLAGLGLIYLQTLRSYIPFLLVYLLIVSMGAHLGFSQTLLTVTNRWFVRRKAVALTILLTGFAAGGAIFVYPLGIGVGQIGWRQTLVYSGIFILITGIGLSRLVRHSPERMGLDTANTPELNPASAIDGSSGEASVKDYTAYEAMRTKAFWLILGASMLRISAETAIFVHIIPIMAWKGMDELSAAGLLSVFFFLSIPFRLFLGIAGQRLPFQPLLVGGLMASVMGLLLVVSYDGTWVLYPFVVLMAVYEGSVVLQWLALGDYFGRRSYGTLSGIMRASDVVGSIMIPLYAGWVFDTTGSYTAALVTLVAMMGAAALLISLVRRPSRA